MTDSRICTTWPPNFSEVLARRSKLLNTIRADSAARSAAMKHYSTHPVDWILDWATTYDPRQKPTTMPFCLFPRQVELVEFLHSCVTEQEHGLIEKCRDAGATFVACAYSVWLWIFWPGAAIGFGSRKMDLVDRAGDPSSIFEKLRQIINLLPRDLFWPEGYDPKQHNAYMKILNPATGASITGEGGDGIGRGGRTLVYFKDESAHYERPELIEASLGDNTNTMIDISSVNGLGNVFHRRRQAGLEWPEKERGRTRVFVFDWRHHPGKAAGDWYERRRAKALQEGLLAQFSQEVDRDYSAAVDNVLIPALWASAAIDAHIKLGFEPTGSKVAAMDVADSPGGDLNAQCIRHGVVVQDIQADGGEADVVARKYFVKAAVFRCDEWRYESAGVGTGARSGARQIVEQNAGRPMPKIIPWSPSHGVKRPAACVATGKVGADVERRNRDHYANGNVQDAWALRERFRKTYVAVTEGGDFDPDELISLPSGLPNLAKLQAEISQPVYNTNTAGKLTFDKQPSGTKSPNLFDAVKICFAELAARPDEPACGVGGVGPAAQGIFVAVG